MSKEREVEVVGQRRKSARILALEEEKRKEGLKRNSSVIAINNNLSEAAYTANGSLENEQQLHHGLAPSSRAMPVCPPLKRGRKQKRLEDLVVPSFAKNLLQQGGENRQHGNTLTRHDQQANGLPSVPWIPEKRVLELILDILQRRDTHKIFAQPVNPKEVDNYYAIIKEPMDFSTMRTKLQAGHYTSLEKFEHDVFLVTSNAMHFNSSTTIYYKEARGVQDVAQVIFQCLRTDPQKLESRLICAIRSGGPGKRPLISEIRGRRAKVPRLGSFRIGPSPLGTRDCRKFGTLSERERPLIPFCNDHESLVSPVYDAYKTLVHIDKNEKFGYKERLLMFVKNLGPTAQKVAARKLIQCLPNYQAPNLSWQTQISNRQQTTQRFLLPSPASSLSLRIPSQSPKIGSTVPTLAVISNNVSSHGKKNTFNLNLQASPVDQGLVGSSYSDNKVHEPADDRRLKIDSLLMPPPKEKSPNDQDVLRKKSFISDNKNAENGGIAIKAHLIGPAVANSSDCNWKMGKLPITFLREKVAGQQNNTGKLSFIFNNSTANGGDDKYHQKGKMVEEKSDFNGNIKKFPGNYFQENATGQLENNIQMPFMLDNGVASDKERYNKFLLKDKMVAETTNLNEKMETFPGNSVMENVSGQQENGSPMSFLSGSDIAANRGRNNQRPLKGKRIDETSDFNEKLGNLPKDFHIGNVAGQPETNGMMSFLVDDNITASGRRDNQYPSKDIMVSETSDRNEKMRNFSGNFLQESVAGQQENGIHMPFMLHDKIASSGGRDDQYCLKEKTASELSAFNEKKGNFPWESVADGRESCIQMPFMLDNNIAANGSIDNSDWLKGKSVGEASAFSQKVGNFSWASVADQRENSIQMPFRLDDNTATNENQDDSDWLKGKTVVEASAFSEKVGNFSWESVAERQENSIQMPFVLDNNIAVNGNKDDSDWLKGKSVGDESAFSEKVGNFSWESVADKRENSIQMPFVLDNNIVANGNKDDSDWLKGKTLAETSAYSEKVGKFSWENVADGPEKSIQVLFMLDKNIAADRAKDNCYGLKGKTVAETSAFNENMGTFQWENVAAQRENSIQVPFNLDNYIVPNRGEDNSYSLKGKTVAELSAFNEKVGNFSWENVVDGLDNITPVPFMSDNIIAASGGKDYSHCLKGKTVAETSAFIEKVRKLPWENTNQAPFMLNNNIVTNGGLDVNYCLNGKTVAETSAFNEKIQNFPWENVAGQRENISQTPFMKDYNVAVNGGNDDSYCLKGNAAVETSAFSEQVANFLCKNGDGQQENFSLAFIGDKYIASTGGKDTGYHSLGEMVAETSAFNEKRGNFSGNFLRENVVGQHENPIQIPFTLDNNIAAIGGRNTKYSFMGKSVAEASDSNDKMEKNSGNFLRENSVGQHESTSQNKCWLASHFRVIPVHDDGDSYTHGSTKTRFRTVDMLAEGNNIINHNDRLQKGKQVEFFQQTSLDRIDQLSTEWESRLNDFVDRSNDLGPTFMSTIPEEMKFLYPSPTSSDTINLLDPLDQSDGLDCLQDAMMGPNYDENYTQVLEGGTGSNFPVTFTNEDNSLNQLNMNLRPDLQAPALSSGQLRVLMPLSNEASFFLHERVDDDQDPQLLYLNDTDQLPDLDLQL